MDAAASDVAFFCFQMKQADVLALGIYGVGTYGNKLMGQTKIMGQK